MLVAIAAQNGADLSGTDTKQAFLYGDMSEDEDVYAQQQEWWFDPIHAGYCFEQQLEVSDLLRYLWLIASAADSDRHAQPGTRSESPQGAFKLCPQAHQASCPGPPCVILVPAHMPT